MKLNILLQEIIKRSSDNENKQDYFERLNQVQDIDIPDTYEKLIEGLSTLIPESEAPKKKEVADKVIQSYRSELEKRNYNELQMLGLEESEINDIIKLPLEERMRKVVDIQRQKIEKQYSMTESERNLEISNRLRQEKERADRYQAALLEREKEFKHNLQKQTVDSELKSLVLSHDFTTTIPDERVRLRTAMQSIEDKLNAVGGKIIMSNGSLRLVDAEDETKEIWDNTNRIVTVQSLVERTLSDLNLITKKGTKTQKQTPSFKPNSNFQVNRNIPIGATTRQEFSSTVSGNQRSENRALDSFKRQIDSLLPKKQ